MDIKPPQELKDCRNTEAIAFDAGTADKYADKGTVMHFAMRLGFYPNDEEQAEGILRRIVLEHEYYESWIGMHECNPEARRMEIEERLRRLPKLTMEKEE